MLKRRRIKKRFTFVIITPESRRMISMKISKHILYASAFGVLALFLIPMVSGISHIKDMMHYLDITYRQKQELNARTRKIDAYEQVFANLRRYAFTPQNTYLPENIGGFSTPFKLEPSMIDNNTLVMDSINQGLIDKSILETQEYYRELTSVFKTTPVGWPIDTNNSYYISSPFGYRVHPFTRNLEFHEGIDIVAPYRSKIYTTADGIVSFAGVRSGYGNCIIIRHRFNYETVYAHLSEIRVRAGANVNRASVIGLLGNSGLSTGPHLHYEVLINGAKTNPIKYLVSNI